MKCLLNITTIEVFAVLLLVLSIIAIGYLWQPLTKRKEAIKKKILTYGEEAEAIVLDIEPTGLYVNNLLQSRVQIQVQPNKGRNFVTEVQQALPDTYFGQLHSGSKIIVKYNPSNHKEIVLVRAA